MKLIKCIMRVEKVDQVVTALQKFVTGMTIYEARGHGRQKGHAAIYRGVEYEVSLLPKIVIEIIAHDNRVDEIVPVLIHAARTGTIGDGRIFVFDVDEAYHIRTGFMELD